MQWVGGGGDYGNLQARHKHGFQLCVFVFMPLCVCLQIMDMYTVGWWWRGALETCKLDKSTVVSRVCVCVCVCVCVSVCECV